MGSGWVMTAGRAWGIGSTLIGCSVVGAVIVALCDALKLFPEHIALFGKAAAAYTIQLETSLIMVGVRIS